MQRSELRLSGSLMTSLAALGIAHTLPKMQIPKHGQVPNPTTLDHAGIVIAAIPVVMNVLIWTTGGILPEELSFAASLAFGIMFALPHWFAAHWLENTPFHMAQVLYECMVLAWIGHLLVTLVFEIRGDRWAHKVLGMPYIERDAPPTQIPEDHKE
jgi:hypothetical protein